MVEYDEGHLQLIFADHMATFKTPAVVKAVKALVAELQSATSDASVGDVIDRAAAASGLEPTLIEHVLELLDGSHCLYVPNPDDRREAIDWFFAAAGDCPSQIRERLARTEVALLCSGRSAALLTQSAQAACLRVKAIEACVGDRIADVMIRLEAACESGASMIGVFDFPTQSALAGQVNAIAFASGIPALYADCRTALAQMGPYVLPGTGGCLECLNLRKLSNSAEEVQLAVSGGRQRLDRVVCDPHPAHPAFLAAVANLFICELADIVVAKPPRLLSSFIEIPQSGLLPTQHDYLRVPRCPCCGAKAPPRYAWNARFGSPEVKNEHNGT